MSNPLKTIRINCDMGEYDSAHLGSEDLKILPYIDQLNIATGGHAGSEQVIRFLVKEACKLRKNIGAHISFPDRANFGRLAMQLSLVELRRSLHKQMNLLQTICIEYKTKLSHVKPHGALYHLVNSQENWASFFLEFMDKYYPKTPIIGMADSLLSTKAQKVGIPYLHEGFADRKYNTKDALAPRHLDGAILSDQESIQRQVRHLVQGTIPNLYIKFNHRIDTICIHSDTPNAAALVKIIYQEIHQ